MINTSDLYNVSYSATMKKEKAKRFKCILNKYANKVGKEQCLTRLIKLDTSSVEQLHTHCYRELLKTKEISLIPNKASSKQVLSMLYKSPVLEFFSTWFYEYDSNSDFKLIDYATKMYCSSADNVCVSNHIPCKNNITHQHNKDRHQLYPTYHL